MKKSRKDLANLLSKVELLKTKYEHLYKELNHIISEQEYEQTIKNHDRVIEQLNKELKLLPIGFRYSGTFYVKNPYTIPATFEKHEGTVYMREDLMTWQVEQGIEKKGYSYRKSIYKEPKDGAELQREDAQPIYTTT